MTQKKSIKELAAHIEKSGGWGSASEELRRAFEDAWGLGLARSVSASRDAEVRDRKERISAEVQENELCAES